ncbi:hypothetical protein DQ04_02051120 [Trypanosoma grayi]|uniref:hypothetical protein n=1 Tax=Trypanosoma grayi TaxID=71804 RepID=UPI0004F40B21|nr:hypothetical protein DQ04_02051120 [Trypanosoma grayi]KEG12047.1 hypothetical protein DQ04_02051120 [Trypanosoma grayi]
MPPPSITSTSRSRTLKTVDLPLPERPMSPMRSRAYITRFTWRNAYGRDSRYFADTSTSSTAGGCGAVAVDATPLLGPLAGSSLQRCMTWDGMAQAPRGVKATFRSVV